MWKTLKGVKDSNKSPNVHWQHQTVCQKWKRIRNPNPDSAIIYSGDIGMKFGLEKYTMFIMKSGKWQMILE